MICTVAELFSKFLDIVGIGCRFYSKSRIGFLPKEEDRPGTELFTFHKSFIIGMIYRNIKI